MRWVKNEIRSPEGPWSNLLSRFEPNILRATAEACSRFQKRDGHSLKRPQRTINQTDVTGEAKARRREARNDGSETCGPGGSRSRQEGITNPAPAVPRPYTRRGTSVSLRAVDKKFEHTAGATSFSTYAHMVIRQADQRV